MAVKIKQKARHYPDNHLVDKNGQLLPGLDIIEQDAFPTLSLAFRERVRRTPDKIAYRQYSVHGNKWLSYSWQWVARQVSRWQQALLQTGIKKGDRVAIRYKNSVQWVIFDQAAQGLGLITVPLYVDDRGDNIAYILNNAECKLLYVQTLDQWQEIRDSDTPLESLQMVILHHNKATNDDLVQFESDFLPEKSSELITIDKDPEECVSIVYTSGTTGRPKGVMLSSKNLVSNVHAGLHSIAFYPDDELLSFLPLSHTLERTGGYHLTIITGSTVNFTRSIADLAEDLQTIKPTVLLAVPRIYERIYGKIRTQIDQGSAIKRFLFNKTVDLGWKKFEYEQGRGNWSLDLLLYPLLDRIVASKVRQKLGGRLRFSLVGGAALPINVARMFIGLGITLVQGYGLTESSPLISISPLEQNIPASIGLPAKGVEVAISEDDELLARGDNIMLGYWKNEQATRQAIDEEGWLHTGDKARIDDKGYIYITGRIKEIIVLANGEKMPPNDIEMAILQENIFEQCMLFGEAKPYLSLLVVLNEEAWPDFAREQGLQGSLEEQDKQQLEAILLQKVADRMKAFPGYAQVRQLRICNEAWSVDNGLLTPTMKLKRAQICQCYQQAIEDMYQGH